MSNLVTFLCSKCEVKNLHNTKSGVGEGILSECYDVITFKGKSNVELL